MPFLSEEHLFRKAFESSFIKNIVEASVYPSVAFIEMKGLFGIPDLVITNLSSLEFNRKIIRSFAFEMKLSNWKKAIMQAYRYRSFANYSFVVLDRAFIKPALNHIEQFELSNIGLISIDTNGFMSIHYYPKFYNPYSIALLNKFESMVICQEIDQVKKKPGNWIIEQNKHLRYFAPIAI